MLRIPLERLDWYKFPFFEHLSLVFYQSSVVVVAFDFRKIQTLHSFLLKLSSCILYLLHRIFSRDRPHSLSVFGIVVSEVYPVAIAVLFADKGHWYIGENQEDICRGPRSPPEHKAWIWQVMPTEAVNGNGTWMEVGLVLRIPSTQLIGIAMVRVFDVTVLVNFSSECHAELLAELVGAWNNSSSNQALLVLLG